MDFTREPIIETIITPKEGYKLVIRSSKSAGQEEYFVDAVEIVAFGHALFFRSMERPKAFLVPVSDYEVLEVREARMVLKNVGLDRSIKIGGGKEANLKIAREEEKNEMTEEGGEREETQSSSDLTETRPEARVDKKRDRRRHYRKRRGRDEGVRETVESSASSLEDEKINIPLSEEKSETAAETPSVTSTLLSSLLQPPPTLISETIGRYRQNELFKGAFYLTEEEQYKPHDKVQELLSEEDEEAAPALQEPIIEPTELVEESLLVESGSAQEIEKSAGEEGENLSVEEQVDFSLPIYADEEDKSMQTQSFHVSEQKEEEPVADHQPIHKEEDESEKT